MTPRADFPHLHPIATRWDDNDAYGHVNYVRHFAFFDTAINDWLVREGGLDIRAGDVIGLCAESHCEYNAAISFPDALEVGLRAGHVGSSSVRYELAVFRAGDEEPAAPAGRALETAPPRRSPGPGGARERREPPRSRGLAGVDGVFRRQRREPGDFSAPCSVDAHTAADPTQS